MIELTMEEEVKDTSCGVSLKVMGVGGAGGNAVNSMIAGAELSGVHFCVTNTDLQALNQSSAQTKIQIGKKITKGLGAGSNPEIGRQSAQEDLDSVLDFLGSTDILFLTAGLGGGTGSGALPVIAQAAKELGILTIAIVCKPFVFEGRRRARQAAEALANLEGSVDTLIVVPNQRLVDLADPNISMLSAFAMANDILKQAIKGISDIITKAGHINVDLADVKTIMRDTGIAIMGTGRATGTDRAREAARAAISSPLLENTNIAGAKGVLVNITGNQDLELQEINQAASMIYEMVSDDANIILGSVIDPSIGDEISITVIATGLEAQAEAAAEIAVTSAARMVRDAQPSPEAMVSSSPRAEGEVASVSTEHADANTPLILRSPQGVSKDMSGASAAIEALEDEPAQPLDLDDLDTPTFLRKQQQETMRADASADVSDSDEQQL